MIKYFCDICEKEIKGEAIHHYCRINDSVLHVCKKCYKKIRKIEQESFKQFTKLCKSSKKN